MLCDRASSLSPFKGKGSWKISSDTSVIPTLREFTITFCFPDSTIMEEFISKTGQCFCGICRTWKIKKSDKMLFRTFKFSAKPKTPSKYVFQKNLSSNSVWWEKDLKKLLQFFKKNKKSCFENKLCTVHFLFQVSIISQTDVLVCFIQLTSSQKFW